MTDAAYFRAQAKLCLDIADCLSDPLAAERTRNTASEYLLRAENLENGKAELSEKNRARRLSPLPIQLLC
jgi:hypothetical protein